nr:T9SS sorting signal type C domain-containing protein [uncultured Flavobacterium sp.]
MMKSYLNSEKMNRFLNFTVLASGKLRLAIIVLVVALFSNNLSAQKTFNSDGTFVVPAGVTSLTVKAWGGGGSGGGATNAGNMIARGGSGGGGGAYASATITVTPGESLSIIVGVGGAKALAGQNGNSGGNSTITGFTSSIFASGGSGGIGNIDGAATVVGGAGGVATAGTTKTAGTAGGSGNTQYDAVSGAGGAGANSGGAGGAGISGLGNTQSGNDGSNPGGGGGGGRTSQDAGSTTGGAGGDGQVIISWTCPTYALTSSASATSVCGSGTSIVTLTSSSLPDGEYTVTYSTSNPTTSSNTATMTFSGTTGTFTTRSLSATSTITVRTISSGIAPANCSSTITTRNTATVTVNSINTVGSASSTPTLCVNTALTNITHTTTRATGIGTAIGLPAGVTASWSSNTITISGTPTASGIFNYSIPLTGGCGGLNATGTITVTATKVAGVASSSPTLCVNTALTDIIHTTTDATGIGTATGLPAGVTASWSSNTITISGTPTASGTFNYSIPLSGGCGSAVNASGTITVTAVNSVGSASSSPTLCMNTVLTNITHATTGATGIGTATGLPAGVTASWSSNTITISGTPTLSGTFNYSIPLSGGCGSVNATGTIIVNDTPTTTGVSICVGEASQSLVVTSTCDPEPQSVTNFMNAASGSSVTGVGTLGWGNPTRIDSDDNIFVSTASVSSNGTITTRYLQGKKYSFAIPNDAIINGIEVSINRYSNRNDASFVKDNVISLIKDGTVTGSNNKVDGKWSTTTSTVVTYGGVSDLWGTTWTPAEINADTFGVALSVIATRSSNNVTASVDYMQIRVAYTINGVINWYTQSSGGTSIGTGTSFNPVGVTDSGLSNTNTPGIYTFYAECSSDAICRTPTNFVINALPTAPTLGTITQPTCATPTTGSVDLTNLPNGGTLSQNNGTSTTEISYSGTTATVSGLVVGTYTFTVSNGSCVSAASANVTVLPIVTNTWNGTSWSPNIPTDVLHLDQNIVFEGDYGDNKNLYGCSCEVKSGNVVIHENYTLKVTNEVKVTGGSLTFLNTASLVQTNDVANTGNITYNRTTPTVRPTDYVYWSSPVSGQTIANFSPTVGSIKYYYDLGWKAPSDSDVMVKGLGYIIRGQVTSNDKYDASFVGVPNNGPVAIPANTAAKYYLVGNPYPSAIDADEFLDQNAGLDGNVYLWTHNTEIAKNAAGTEMVYTSDDYANYNFTGSTSTFKSEECKTCPNNAKPIGKIAAGQSFFVKTISATTIQFNNDMRLESKDKIDNSDQNSQFFRTTNTNTTKSKTAVVEKHRLWLNLTNDQGAFKQTLIGYVTGATNDLDARYDGQNFNGNAFINFYSINQNKNFTIQGRALPFDESDEVALGFKSTMKGSFTIAIDEVDGLFANQDVFIEDKLKGVTFNLKTGNYTFDTEEGTFNERFVIRYINRTLATEDFTIAPNKVLVSVKNKQMKINAAETIDKVVVYDLLGREIFKKSNVNEKELTVLNLISNEQALVVKMIFSNGKIVSRKVVY